MGTLYHSGAANHCLSLHADAQTDSTMFNALLLCPDLYEEKKGNLGPDPLREDADKELLWERMHKGKQAMERDL